MEGGGVPNPPRIIRGRGGPGGGRGRATNKQWTPHANGTDVVMRENGQGADGTRWERGGHAGQRGGGRGARGSGRGARRFPNQSLRNVGGRGAGHFEQHDPGQRQEGQHHEERPWSNGEDVQIYEMPAAPQVQVVDQLQQDPDDDQDFPEPNEPDLEAAEEREKFYQELLKAREVERKQAILDGKMNDPNARYRMEDAITIVGTCLDMCPRLERYRREREMMLQEWELVPGTRRVDHKRAVKMYERAPGDKIIPSDIRPPKVLKKTLNYLFRDLLPRGGFSATYKFIRDRTRAVRNDFTIQREQGAIAMECFDRCARFHILALHFERDRTDFSIPMEEQQLMYTLQSLKEFYTDERERYESPNELEMRVYLRLAHIRDMVQRRDNIPDRIINHPVYQLTNEFRKHVQDFSSPITKSSDLKVGAAGFEIFGRLAAVLREMGNVVMIYLVACILERHFGKDTIENMEDIRAGLTVTQIIDGVLLAPPRTQGVGAPGEAHIEDLHDEEELMEDDGDYQYEDHEQYDGQEGPALGHPQQYPPANSISWASPPTVAGGSAFSGLMPTNSAVPAGQSAFSNITTQGTTFPLSTSPFGSFPSATSIFGPQPTSAPTPSLERPQVAQANAQTGSTPGYIFGSSPNVQPAANPFPVQPPPTMIPHNIPTPSPLKPVTDSKPPMPSSQTSRSFFGPATSSPFGPPQANPPAPKAQVSSRPPVPTWDGSTPATAAKILDPNAPNFTPNFAQSTSIAPLPAPIPASQSSSAPHFAPPMSKRKSSTSSLPRIDTQGATSLFNAPGVPAGSTLFGFNGPTTASIPSGLQTPKEPPPLGKHKPIALPETPTGSSFGFHLGATTPFFKKHGAPETPGFGGHGLLSPLALPSPAPDGANPAAGGGSGGWGYFGAMSTSPTSTAPLALPGSSNEALPKKLGPSETLMGLNGDSLLLNSGLNSGAGAKKGLERKDTEIIAEAGKRERQRSDSLASRLSFNIPAPFSAGKEQQDRDEIETPTTAKPRERKTSAFAVPGLPASAMAAAKRSPSPPKAKQSPPAKSKQNQGQLDTLAHDFRRKSHVVRECFSVWKERMNEQLAWEEACRESEKYGLKVRKARDGKIGVGTGGLKRLRALSGDMTPNQDGGKVNGEGSKKVRMEKERSPSETRSVASAATKKKERVSWVHQAPRTDEELAKRLKENHEEHEKCWAKGTLLQTMRKHVTTRFLKPSSLFASNSKSLSTPTTASADLSRSLLARVWACWISMNPENDATAIWLESKFNIPESGKWSGDTAFEIPLLEEGWKGKGKGKQEDSPDGDDENVERSPALIIFECTPLDRLEDEIERKYRILDDCARLRDLLNNLPQTRHFKPALLVIQWPDNSKFKAVEQDFLRMIKKYAEDSIILGYAILTTSLQDAEAKFAESLDSLPLDMEGKLVSELTPRGVFKVYEHSLSGFASEWLDNCTVYGEFDWVLYGKILKALVDVLNQVALLCFSLAFGERAAEELLDDVGDVFPDLDAAAISDSDSAYDHVAIWLASIANPSNGSDRKTGAQNVLTNLEAQLDMGHEFPARGIFYHLRDLAITYIEGDFARLRPSYSRKSDGAADSLSSMSSQGQLAREHRYLVQKTAIEWHADEFRTMLENYREELTLALSMAIRRTPRRRERMEVDDGDLSLSHVSKRRRYSNSLSSEAELPPMSQITSIAPSPSPPQQFYRSPASFFGNGFGIGTTTSSSLPPGGSMLGSSSQFRPTVTFSTPSDPVIPTSSTNFSISAPQPISASAIQSSAQAFSISRQGSPAASEASVTTNGTTVTAAMLRALTKEMKKKYGGGGEGEAAANGDVTMRSISARSGSGSARSAFVTPNRPASTSASRAGGSFNQSISSWFRS